MLFSGIWPLCGFPFALLLQRLSHVLTSSLFVQDPVKFGIASLNSEFEHNECETW